ncbi:hypothetical protein PVAND_013469 [Polypedilum vanderplanki]|uniref:Ionotropic receptor n=1 Tax=Polypedilum vanderplanki TaxID=319348 RepID=A0A9J6CQS9_POLVA|nr:hypothetical protein PVAND_013469 [Polypedilum vanderplanki]
MKFLVILYIVLFKTSKCFEIYKKFVISFLNEVNSHQGIIFHCGDSFNFRHFYEDNQNYYLSIHHLSKVNENNIETIMQVNYHKIGLIIDTNCNETLDLFNICSTLNFFNASYNWFMLSDNFSSSIEQLNRQNINLDAEITLAIIDKNASKFLLYDVYNPSYKYGAENVITEKGTFDIKNGFNITLNGTKLERRRNLQGITVNVAIVATGVQENQTLFEYLESTDRPLLDAQHRHSYGLHKILSEKYNYSLFIHRSTSWGFLRNGSYDGIMRMYNSSQIDFSITPFRHTIDRSFLIDHTLTTWVLAPMLVFRHPKKSLRSPFLMPLSPWVWNMILIFIFIISCLITLTMKSDKVKNVTLIRAFMNAVGVMCQQGFTEEYRKSSVRFLLITFILFSSLIYQFYSSYIVGSLLTDQPKTINNLRQLIDSGIDIGIEDTAYNHDFLETTTDPLAIEIYNTRILKNHPEGNYMDVNCGIEKIQKGNFAFQVETAYAYRLIEGKFTDDEICELHQMYLFAIRLLGVTIVKGSPFKQLLTTEFIKLTENGIISYQNSKWQKKKPKCIKSVTKIKSVDLNDTSWVFILLVTMILMSFVIALCEKLHFLLIFKVKIFKKFSYKTKDKNMKIKKTNS